jgi:peptidoglycan/xylan/chitin deacetylase (PgdA/CDA1 family)
MGWSELEGLAGLGIEVAAHSSNHVDLRTLTDSDLAEDLSVCRKQLEDRIGKRVTSLAYPYGTSDARVRRVASERFTLACGTRLRRVSPNSDPFDLPRLDMHYFRRPERFWSVLEGRGGSYLSLRRVFREARLCLFQ